MRTNEVKGRRMISQAWRVVMGDWHRGRARRPRPYGGVVRLRDKSRSLASATSSLLAWSLLFSQDLFGDVDLGLGDVDGVAGAVVVVVLGQDEGADLFAVEELLPHFGGNLVLGAEELPPHRGLQSGVRPYSSPPPAQVGFWGHPKPRQRGRSPLW